MDDSGAGPSSAPPSAPGPSASGPGRSAPGPGPSATAPRKQASKQAAPRNPKPSASNDDGLQMTPIGLAGELIHVPTVIMINEGAFRSLVSLETFKKLPPEAQRHLKQFLPQFNDEDEDRKTLEAVFTTSQSFNFGNPIGKFHDKLKHGWFNTDRPSDRVLLRDNHRVLYDHYIRFYEINLLKKLLASRHAILEHQKACSPMEEPGPLPLDETQLKRREVYNRLHERSTKRARLMIGECRGRAGESGVSSDEEPEPPVLPTAIPKMPAIAAGRTTLHSTVHKDVDIHQPLYIDDVHAMVKKYRKLKKNDPSTPSLDLANIHLDAVLERSGVQSVSERIRQTKQTLEQMEY